MTANVVFQREFQSPRWSPRRAGRRNQKAAPSFDSFRLNKIRRGRECDRHRPAVATRSHAPPGAANKEGGSAGPGESEAATRGGRHHLAVDFQCLSQNFDAAARSRAEKFPKARWACTWFHRVSPRTRPLRTHCRGVNVHGCTSDALCCSRRLIQVLCRPNTRQQMFHFCCTEQLQLRNLNIKTVNPSTCSKVPPLFFNLFM